MKTKLVLHLFSCLLSMSLIFAAACAPAAALPSPPAPAPAPATALPAAATPAATARAELAPLDAFLAALDALNASPGFTFTTRYTSLVTQKVMLPGQPASESSSLVTTSDSGARLLVDGQPNIGMTRKIDFLGGSSAPDLQVEMRLVGGQAYGRAAYAQLGTDLPALPDGWLPLYGETSLAYWPTLSDASLLSITAELKGDAWTLVSGSPAGRYRQALAGSLASVSEAGGPAGGAGVDRVITLTLKASALRALARWVDFTNPVNGRVVDAIQGTPLTLALSLDAAGQPVALVSKITGDVENMDIGGVEGLPAGAGLTIHVALTSQVDFQTASLPQAAKAPGPAEMAPDLAYTGAGARVPFKTLRAFDQLAGQAAASGQMAGLWQALEGATMPLVFGDSAVFLYHGQASQVSWPGDWNDRAGSAGRPLGDTQTWWMVLHLPEDARLEYQVQVDSRPPAIDPLNPLSETGGLGSKSVVMMPAYQPPDFTEPRPGVARGQLTGDLTTQSQVLGYPVRYRVYTPAGYEKMGRLPALYVTDGQDFLAFGRLDVALDNLIAAGQTRPLIAVFIDPRDVKTGENLREKQLLDNPKYGDFIAKELVPAVDRAYRTNPSAGARGILGASYGGYFGANFALAHSDLFHQVGLFSPVMGYNPAAIDAYRQAERLPLNFFIATGTWSDVSFHARLFRDALEAKGYPLVYLESNEGHSYATWRGKFDRMLACLFPPEE